MIRFPVGASIRPAEISQRPAGVTSFRTRAPQVPQKARRAAAEESYQTSASAPVIRTSLMGAARKALKLPCMRWQSSQWQARTPAAARGRLKVTAPQWQCPVRGTSGSSVMGGLPPVG
jgi:hypothetical protein